MMRYFFAVLFSSISFLFVAQTIEVKPVCFNTINDEFGIRQVGDKWYVLSAALSGKDGFSELDPTTKKPYTDLYIVDGCNLKEATLMSNEFKKQVTLSSMYQDGPLTGTSDFLFFTNNSGEKGSEKLGLFYLLRMDTLWSNSYEFPYNSKKYNISHPFFHAKSNTLYYVSDEKGSLDIYSITFDGNIFGIPQEITSINTDSVECFPIVFNDELYFTSNRKESIGGYDLFAYKKDSILSMGEPFNSPFDDLAVIFQTDSTGFLSSNRASKGLQDDVYSFLMIQPKLNPIIKDTTVESQLALLEENQNHLKQEFKELLTLRDSAIKIGVSKDILALVNKSIRSYENAFPTSIDKLSLDQLTAANKEFDGTRALIEQQIAQKLNANYNNPDLLAQANELLKNAKIENVEFALNSATIEGEYLSLLKGASELLKANNTWKLTLSGHTDNIGSAPINLDLSKRRALAVKSLLVKNGVAAARITVEYFGLTKPLVENNSEENRHKNRRVEFNVKAN